VWDLQTGTVIHTLQGHMDAVLFVSISFDGKLGVSVSRHDGKIVIWDLVRGGALRTVDARRGSVSSIALLPDGRRAVIGTFFGTLEVWEDIWNLDPGVSVRTFVGHSGEVSSLAATPDGRRVVSSGWDRTLKLWDLSGIPSVAVTSGKISGTRFVGGNTGSKTCGLGDV
jgi:WD40 repeat protein